MARAEQKWEQALELCETAVQLKRKEIQLHMNLVEAVHEGSLKLDQLTKKPSEGLFRFLLELDLSTGYGQLKEEK